MDSVTVSLDGYNTGQQRRLILNSAINELLNVIAKQKILNTIKTNIMKYALLWRRCIVGEESRCKVGGCGKFASSERSEQCLACSTFNNQQIFDWQSTNRDKGCECFLDAVDDICGTNDDCSTAYLPQLLSPESFTSERNSSNTLLMLAEASSLR
jgi:hypothetical protein